MIQVDSRTGSGELVPYFKPYGIVPQLTTLEFGDFAFEGRGPKGLCGVVFERKRIEDLLDSMKSDRLAGYQLPGLAKNYDYGYLIIEGVWRTTEEGFLEVRNRWGWMHHDISTRGVHNFIMGLALRAGMIPWRTYDQKETAAFVVDQYRMWEKPWHTHTSHDAVYAPAQGGGFGLNILHREISLAEKVAMQLPFIDKKARYVARHFKTVRAMINAPIKDWAKVPWTTGSGKARVMGEVTAKKIVGAIVK